MLLAFSMRSPSFLAQPDWLEIPWTTIEKSSRDRLYDIAAEITILYSVADGNCQTYLRQCQKLCHKLMIWRRNWLETDYPELEVSCQGCHEELCGCFQHHSVLSCNEFSYVTAECMAFLLLVTYMALGMVKHLRVGPVGENNLPEYPLDMNLLQRRAQRLRNSLQKTLTLPCFGQAVSDIPGITEGRCRSLLPTWVLSQHLDMRGSPENDWWCSLNSRVNYGMAAYDN